MICDAQGVPLAGRVTAANVNDVTMVQELVEAIPPVAGKPGRPRHRPERVQADRGFDAEAHRHWLRAHHMEPVLAKRGTPHGSGLGKTRWVVERTLAWVHQFRRLRVRWERRGDIHYAFFHLALALITRRFLKSRPRARGP